jgi:catechol-2,3-dioxygenase
MTDAGSAGRENAPAVDVTHLHLHVRDRPRSVDFYRRWFGMSVRRENAEITFVSGSRGFLLALMSDAEPAPPPPWLHFGIATPTLDALRALHTAMQRAGVPVVKRWHEEETFASFRCADPDGYAVEVYWED